MHFLKKIVQLSNNHRGSTLMLVLVFGAVAFTVIISGVATYGLYEHRAANKYHYRDQAFHIAEAGINYYRWHLAHNPTDFTDGTGEAGPYVHEYTDKDGNLVGYYSLEIDAPPTGTTVVTIRSTGWTTADESRRRTIQVRVGFPGLADYVFLNNSSMNFSFTTEVHGQVHSNGGIRFDGTTDSWVTSAKETYKYQNQTHKGVWGGGGPKSFWKYPVPWVDFDSISADLAVLEDLAMEDGGVLLSTSGKEGWHIVFATSTYDLYTVDTRDCYNGEGSWKKKKGVSYWDGNVYCEDIGTETFVSSNPLPANGVIFSYDNVWVEGVVDGRLTVGVGQFPAAEPYKHIYIAGNLRYAEQSSDDVIGLIAQGDILVPYEVPDTMYIDAAILSQYGSIYRPYYYDDLKDALTIFGSQISYLTGGWKYVNGWGNVISGFEDTTHLYDGNLKYYPPIGFPVEATYELISWEELL